MTKLDLNFVQDGFRLTFSCIIPSPVGFPFYIKEQGADWLILPARPASHAPTHPTLTTSRRGMIEEVTSHSGKSKEVTCPRYLCSKQILVPKTNLFVVNEPWMFE